jgi:hypothetical protein
MEDSGSMIQPPNRFSRNILLPSCFWAIATGTLGPNALGQSPEKSVRKALASRLAMLDPNKAEEYASEAESLRMETRKETDELLGCMVECYLALAGGDRPSLTAAIGQSTRHWSQIPEDLRPTVLRLSLAEAIGNRVEKRAETIYKELTRSALREDAATAARRESAELIGFVNGLLGNDETMISPEVRSKAESLMNADKVVGAKYATGRQKGEEARKFLDAQKAAREQLLPKERDAQIVQDRSELDELEADHESKLNEARVENADQNAVRQQNFVIRNRLVGNLQLVIQESYFPTLGHPGNPPVPPSKPNRDHIKVDKYRREKVKRGDKWEEKEIEKSRDEIEWEKDRRFVEWQLRYQREKPIYDQAKPVWDRLFQAWQTLDALRRKELFDLYNDLSTRIEQIDREKRESDQAKEEAMQEINRMNDSVQKLRNKVRVWQELDEGDQRGEQDYFIRACVWEGVDRSRELQHILRWIRTTP